MREKISQLFLVNNEDAEISEKVYKIVLFIGSIMTVFGTIENMFIIEDAVVNTVMAILVGIMLVCIILTVRFNRTSLASTIMGIILIGIIFPSMFILSGGINGGATLWMAVGPIYACLMFSKRKLKIFLVIAVLVDICIYALAYTNENFVHSLANKEAIYFDSLVSVLLVGMGIGAILKFQAEMYAKERLLNLKQKEELQNASRAQSAFFANMSHEIRTPINTIIGLNEMIMRSNPSDEVAEYAGDIQVASKMLLNLINDVLDVTQLEMKKMELVLTEYNTKELFGELIDLIQVQIKAKNLILLVDIDRNLPVRLLGDEKRIKQIVLNILTNAVKYTPSGSVIFSVRSEVVNSNRANLRISVADTGLGIKKENLKHLYDSFKRLDSEKNKGVEGSGLGLSITKQLVGLMNGKLTVDSIYTKGSTFTVSIEQQIVDYTPIGNVEFFKTGLKKYNYKQSFEAPEARILIVDDNRMNTSVESKLLEATKIQIDVANSGEECLELTKHKFYHVILMDYMMTGINGVETLQQIRSQDNGLCRNSAVIILTANAVEDARSLCEEYGFDGYLEKPVTGTKLEAEVMKFIPQEILENLSQEIDSVNSLEGVRKYTHGKKRKVIITTDCVSDLPFELVEQYGIKTMYLYIKTATGRFADTVEIDSDNLVQFMDEGIVNANSDSVTVEEYEQFFADALTQADTVIHISMASRSGKTYDVAVAAAQGFDHVNIIDSGQISGGEGILVLHAAKLANNGTKAEEIIKAVEAKKKLINCQFHVLDAATLKKSGYLKKNLANLINAFGFHLILGVRNGRIGLKRISAGQLQKSRMRYVRRCLGSKRHIDDSVVFITHVNCNYRDLKAIKDEILKCCPFKNVIINKASFSTSCNGGIYSIGIAYFKKGEQIL